MRLLGSIKRNIHLWPLLKEYRLGKQQKNESGHQKTLKRKYLQQSQ